MKKRFCVVLTVCFTIALFFSSQAVWTVGADGSDYVQDTDVDEFYKDLVEARGEEFANNLYRAYENDEALMALFPKNESGEPVYPDFIGGIYYNDDGNMVVQLVTDAQTNDVDLRTAVDNLIAERNIIVEYAEFSHNEISATMDTLNALYLADDRPDAFDNVDSIAESTSNNRIEIRMRVCNEEEIARFKETVLDSPILSFVQSSGPTVPAAPPNNVVGGMQSGGTTAAGQQEQHLNWYWPLVVVLCIGLLAGAWFFLFRRQARPAFAGVDAEGVSNVHQGSSVSQRQIVAAIRSSDCVPREDLLEDILEKIKKQH